MRLHWLLVLCLCCNIIIVNAQQTSATTDECNGDGWCKRDNELVARNTAYLIVGGFVIFFAGLMLRFDRYFSLVNFGSDCLDRRVSVLLVLWGAVLFSFFLVQSVVL